MELGTANDTIVQLLAGLFLLLLYNCHSLNDGTRTTTTASTKSAR